MAQVTRFTIAAANLTGSALKIYRTGNTTYKAVIGVTRYLIPGTTTLETFTLTCGIALFEFDASGNTKFAYVSPPSVTFSSTEFGTGTYFEKLVTFTFYNDPALFAVPYTGLGLFSHLGTSANIPVDLAHLYNGSNYTYTLLTGSQPAAEGGGAPNPTGYIPPFPTAGMIRIVPNVRTTTGTQAESGGWQFYEAPANCVLTGRLHTGDENGPTAYEYATLKAIDTNGNTVAGTIDIVDQEWSDWKPEPNGGLVYNPQFYWAFTNRVLTGRQHQNDENGLTRYKSAAIKFNGAYCSVNFNRSNQGGDFINFDHEDSHADFRTATFRVLLGRCHNGDETHQTGYFSGTIYYSAFTPPAGTPPAGSNSSPVYEFYYAQYGRTYFSPLYGELGEPEGALPFKRIAFYGYKTQLALANLVPIYVYRSFEVDFYWNQAKQDNFGSQSDYKYMGIAFYAFKVQVSGTIPFYSYFYNGGNAPNNRHLLSKDVGASFTLDGRTFNRESVMFYAYPAY